LPLVIAQALALFVLLRRYESQPWRESVAIFDVAAVATAISLISQTYQIQGTLADFMLVWLLLSIPIVYLFRTTLGAVGYLIGTVVWLFARESWFTQRLSPNLFWLFLLLVLPYYFALLRRDRTSRSVTILSIFLIFTATIGLAFTAEFTGANIGALAFAGLFAAAYLCGMKFFPAEESQRLHPLALIGGLGVGIIAIVLSFQGTWHMTSNSHSITGTTRAIGIGIELFFPVAAILLLITDYLRKRRIMFSVAAATIPLVATLAWVIANLAPATNRGQDTPYSLGAAVIFDVYALVLGIELIARGVRASSLTRANFGLLVIAALAIARFFDSDLGFVTRGLGFIVVGAGFLVANIIFFKKRVTT
jgi:hypothetical protein